MLDSGTSTPTKPAAPKTPTTFGNSGTDYLYVPSTGNQTHKNPALGYAPAPVSPTPAPAPAPVKPSPGGGTSGSGGVGVNATGQGANYAATNGVTAPNDEAWWMSDPTFQAEDAGNQSTLKSATDALITRRAGLDGDFLRALMNLGWNPNSNSDLQGGGQWNATDKLGAYGAGLNNLQNDFAGRNMLGSSFYGDALTNFGTDMNNQKSAMNQQYMNSGQQITNDQAAAQAAYTAALARAKQSSLARRDVANSLPNIT
jgi:hypothetical protein